MSAGRSLNDAGDLNLERYTPCLVHGDEGTTYKEEGSLALRYHADVGQRTASNKLGRIEDGNQPALRIFCWPSGATLNTLVAQNCQSVIAAVGTEIVLHGETILTIVFGLSGKTIFLRFSFTFMISDRFSLFLSLSRGLSS